MIGTFNEFITQYRSVCFNIPHIQQENPLVDFGSGVILEGVYKGNVLFTHFQEDDYPNIAHITVQEGKMTDKDIDVILNKYQAQKQQEIFVTNLCDRFIVGVTAIIFFICVFVVDYFYPQTTMPIYIDKVIIMILAGIIGGGISGGYLVDWQGFNRGNVYKD